jgi:hypothetical protein
MGLQKNISFPLALPLFLLFCCQFLCFFSFILYFPSGLCFLLRSPTAVCAVRTPALRVKVGAVCIVRLYRARREQPGSELAASLHGGRVVQRAGDRFAGLQVSAAKSHRTGEATLPQRPLTLRTRGPYEQFQSHSAVVTLCIA